MAPEVQHLPLIECLQARTNAALRLIAEPEAFAGGTVGVRVELAKW